MKPWLSLKETWCSVVHLIALKVRWFPDVVVVPVVISASHGLYNRLLIIIVAVLGVDGSLGSAQKTDHIPQHANIYLFFIFIVVDVGKYVFRNIVKCKPLIAAISEAFQLHLHSSEPKPQVRIKRRPPLTWKTAVIRLLTVNVCTDSFTHGCGCILCKAHVHTVMMLLPLSCLPLCQTVFLPHVGLQLLSDKLL